MMIPFRISQIKTQQFAMFPDLLVNGKEVTVDSEFSFGVNTEVKNILCVTKLSYRQDDNLLLTTEVHCIFNIREDGTNLLKEQGRVGVEFLRYLATITTGTARGIVHTKTENTVLNSVVVPPINLVEAIKEDFVFKPGRQN